MAVPCPLLYSFHLHRYPMDGNLHGTQRSSGTGSAQGTYSLVSKKIWKVRFVEPFLVTMTFCNPVYSGVLGWLWVDRLERKAMGNPTAYSASSPIGTVTNLFLDESTENRSLFTCFNP